MLWSKACARHSTIVLMYDACQNVLSSDHKPIKFLCQISRDPRLTRKAGTPRDGDSGLAPVGGDKGEEVQVADLGEGAEQKEVVGA